MEPCFLQMLANSPYRNVTAQFITKGGRTLEKHLGDKNTLTTIKNGNWGYVILQEQSQTPALPGKYQQSFLRSVKAFTHIIRKAGAKPVLYMTWGRRDGDAMNKDLFPDYETMQM